MERVRKYPAKYNFVRPSNKTVICKSQHYKNTAPHILTKVTTFCIQHANEHLVIPLIITMIFVTRKPTAALSIGDIPGWSKFHIIV